MTIAFKCPHCEKICAFQDKHAGRRAKCLTCQKHFIIPAGDGEKAQKDKEQKAVEKPYPGFYEAVLVKSFIIFSLSGNLKIIYQICPYIVIKFILGFMLIAISSLLRVPKAGDIAGVFMLLIVIPISITITLAYFCTWGRILSIYTAYLYDCAFGLDGLPVIKEEKEFALWEYMLKPFLRFFITILAAMFPYAILVVLLENPQTYKGVFVLEFGRVNILQFFFAVGILSIPMTIINMTIGEDIGFLRPDKIILPVFRTMPAYLIVVLIWAGAFYLETLTSIDKKAFGNVLDLIIKAGLNVLVQVPIFFAMRSAGLLYRYYGCYFPY